jgi:hypothetical protein
MLQFTAKAIKATLVLNAAEVAATDTLHEDTLEELRALLIDRVQSSSQPQTVKDKLIGQIRALPTKGMEVITTELLKKAVAQAPDIIIGWLQILL